MAREAFRLVWQLQSVYPDRPEAVAYDRALVPLVDVLAASADEVDNAYYLLEEMHKEVGQCMAAAHCQHRQRARTYSSWRLLTMSLSARLSTPLKVPVLRVAALEAVSEKQHISAGALYAVC